jgi:DNA-binding HxlR family transcriptional regulator
MRGLTNVKRDIIFSIKEKELQLSKLKEHIDKSQVCADLYNKVLLEKAILTKELEELQNKSIVNRIKHLLPHKEKLICDYFKGS